MKSPEELSTSVYGQSWELPLTRFVEESSVPLDFVGLGNPIRQDDGSGLVIVARLRKATFPNRSRSLTFHASNGSPERLLSRLAGSSHRVVVFDAVQAALKPGTPVCARLDDTKYGFFATHNIPLRLIPGLHEAQENFLLVGIQPGWVDVGEGLSPEVEESVAIVVSAVSRALGEKE